MAVLSPLPPLGDGPQFLGAGRAGRGQRVLRPPGISGAHRCAARGLAPPPSGRARDEGTRAMKFGLFYLPTYIPDARDVGTHFDNIVQQVVYADRAGIDYVWMVEH